MIRCDESDDEIRTNARGGAKLRLAGPADVSVNAYEIMNEKADG